MAVTITDQTSLFADLINSSALPYVNGNRPHITGGHAKLFRYDTTSEKTLVNLGAYVAGANTTYNYPGIPEGSIVDQDYVKVYVDDMLLKYYSHTSGSGDAIQPVSGYSNRIKGAGSLVFKTANGTSRSASFYERDVAIGDVVYLQKSDLSVSHTSTVIDFVPEVVAGSVGSVSAVSGNASQAGASVTMSLTSGSANGVSHSANDGAYNPFFSGYVNEVYTVKVLTGGAYETATMSVTSSSGLDNVTSVTTSKSGVPMSIGTRGLLATFTGGSFIAGTTWTITVNKYYAAITSSTSGGTYTGTKDLTYIVTVTQGGWAGSAATLSAPVTAPTGTAATTSGADLAGAYYVGYSYLSPDGETTVIPSAAAISVSSPNNSITVTLPGAASAPAGAVGYNIYLGSAGGANTTLKLYARSVSIDTTSFAITAAGSTAWNGGSYANAAAVPTSNTATVSACLVSAVDTTGVDSSGPTVVPSNRTVSIGSYGATITLGTTAGNGSKYSGNPYVAGDKFTFTATAASDGAVKTLVLADNLPSGLTGDLTTKLYIKKNAVLPKVRLESPSNYNYVVGSDTVTVNASSTAFDSSWTVSGVEQALPIEGGTLYLEYRAWLSTFTGNIFEITSRDNLVTLLGPEDPDNPLCYAVGKALLNTTGGLPVYFTAVEDPAEEEYWDDVLNTIDKADDLYGLVPLTNSESIIDKWVAYAVTHSGSDYGQPRKVFSALKVNPIKPIVTEALTTDEEVALATLADNPAVTGTQYTLLTCTTSNAKFVTKGVRAGDKVRFLYSIDNLGEVTYEEFTVATVNNEDELVLQDAYSSAVSTAQKFEIHRNLTRAEVTTEYTDAIAAKKNSRWIPVVPGTVYDGSVAVEGYHACAALAALVGSVCPQQTIRYSTLSGFTSVASMVNSGQMNDIEAAGATTLSVANSTVFVRRARTSDNTSIETTEEASQRISDTVTIVLRQLTKDLYGRANVVANNEDVGAVAELRNNIHNTLLSMVSINLPRLGGIISSFTIDSVRPSIVSPDTVVVQFTIVKPYALGQATLLLVVGS